jgi:hypothetical protein
VVTSQAGLVLQSRTACNSRAIQTRKQRMIAFILLFTGTQNWGDCCAATILSFGQNCAAADHGDCLRLDGDQP